MSENSRHLEIQRVLSGCKALAESSKSREHGPDIAGSLTDDARLRAREIENRGRCPGQLAAIHKGRGSRSQRRGNIVESSRLLPARQVGARRHDGADFVEHLATRPHQRRHTHTDRPRLLPAEPRKAMRGVWQDERERAWKQRPTVDAGSSGTCSSRTSTDAATSADDARSRPFKE